MTRTASSLRRPLAGLAGLVLAVSLAGCDRDSVVTAGRTRVSGAELEVFLARRSPAADAAGGDALEVLGTRALLAEAARRAGLDEDPVFRARLAATRRELLAQAYLDRELASAEREDLLRQRYDAKKKALTRRRVHVAQIAFHYRAGEAGARETAQSRAARAYARLQGGEPFEKLAKELSEDAATAARGGDLGPVLEGEVDPAFFEAAAALGHGRHGPPVETAYGFHVLRALEPVTEVAPAFEEVRATLAGEARREAEAALVGRLRGEIGVELHRERAAKHAPARVVREGEKR